MAESSSLDIIQLTDWVEGRLSESAAQAIAARVAVADPATRATVAWLRAFRQMSAQVAIVAPPPAVHQALVQQFAAFARERKGPGLFQRLVATLMFDSGLQPLASGVRSAPTQPSQRQLLFAAEIADVALNIHPRHQDQRVDLSGQIFAQNDHAIGGRVVQLMRGDTQLDIATTDELGEFGFDAVSPGTYALTVAIGQAQILITPVELRM